MDKFRGTMTAAEAASAVRAGVRATGATCDAVAVADGGEGLLDVLGGANRSARVTGPSGTPVEAGWRLDGRTAVIEMARAAGLALAGGPEGNDPVAATTAGVGQLLSLALDAGARRIIVGLGGSATTDGGLGALESIRAPGRLRGVELVVACDVRTRFVDAAGEFGPQKGASPAQVALLSRRLERLAQRYRDERGCDVTAVPGAGAAGGLAGGLLTLGGRLVGGFELVADELGLQERMEGADVVVTGEGMLDEHSFDGKVVGGVCELAEVVGVPVLVVAGVVADGVVLPDGVRACSLVGRFGEERALAQAAACVSEVVRAELSP
jgi:glycerate kinase